MPFFLTHTLPEPCYIYVLCPVVFICRSIFSSTFFWKSNFIFCFLFLRKTVPEHVCSTDMSVALAPDQCNAGIGIAMSDNVATTKMNHRSTRSFFPELSTALPSLHQHQFPSGCIQMSRRLFAEAFTGSPWEPRAVQTHHLSSPEGDSSGLCADFKRLVNGLIAHSINLITIHCNMDMANSDCWLKNKYNLLYYVYD